MKHTSKTATKMMRTMNPDLSITSTKPAVFVHRPVFISYFDISPMSTYPCHPAAVAQWQST